MITKKEIDEKSKELGVNTSDVQRDYIFGWLLSGIHNVSDYLKNKLILKGGNGFRKAYFENTRYSNDLDFSTQTNIDEKALKEEINKVCGYIADNTKISFAIKDNRVDIKRGADGESKTYEARVYFKGFYGEESYKIKATMDIKEFDRIFLPVQTRRIIHSYSDYKECNGEIKCLKLEELLASKLNALLHRYHSPDLYDFVYSIFFQKVLAIDRKEVITTFLKKTIYEPDPRVAQNLLLKLPLNIIKAFWNSYLVCPKQSLITFEDAEAKFKEAIPSMFSLLPSFVSVAAGAGGVRVNFDYFSPEYRNLIMEAGKERALVKMIYESLERLVEPYALKYKIRQDGKGREYFYGWDITGGKSGKLSIKMYTQDKVQSMEKTSQNFDPRFEIELFKENEANSYFGKPFSSRKIASTGRIRRSLGILRPRVRTGIVYIIQCPYCLKRFYRSSLNTTLNKHKDKFGNICYGRIGNYIEQKFRY